MQRLHVLGISRSNKKQEEGCLPIDKHYVPLSIAAEPIEVRTPGALR